MAVKTAKLNQIIAVEKSSKEQTHREVTEIYKTLQKSEPMQGLSRTYAPLTEEGEKLPAENKYVQVNVLEGLEALQRILTKFFDLTLTKDAGNMTATGDIIVEGQTFMEKVPVPFLLFLEKHLVDLRTIFTHLPKLDPGEKWAFDEGQGFFKSEPTVTARTKKTMDFVIAAPATDKHPAQVKEVTRDEIAGYWTSVKYSATLEPTRVQQLLDRVDSLLKAVKFAREQANSIEVEQKQAAETLFNYIFAD